MRPLTPSTEQTEVFVIPAHTLYGNYPPKIPESEIKPIVDTGEIVLSRVVVPEYIIVHDGSPRDSTASNYYVKYKDYIKNVASSEIYTTWTPAAIRANVLAIMSFTLNRVYTEWYRDHILFNSIFLRYNNMKEIIWRTTYEKESTKDNYLYSAIHFRNYGILLRRTK